MALSIIQNYSVGTSGWSYAQWKQGLYAGYKQSQWLSRYSQLFHVVELNSSFYRLPTEASIHKWISKTPDDFCFAVKAWRDITHNARLRDCAGKLSQCLKLFRLFGHKLGPVLFQLPPSLQRDDALLADFLALLPADMQFVCEFRHPSWQHDSIYAQLENANVTLCHAHMKEWLGPKTLTSDTLYARLHGSEDWFKGAYSAYFLETFADFIRQNSHIKQAYVFFNNTIYDDDAPNNAATLQMLLQA